MSEPNFQIQNFIHKIRYYSDCSKDLEELMIKADSFLERAHNYRSPDVEYAMRSLGRALDLHVTVSITQAGFLLSIASDMCPILKYLPTVDGNVLREALKRTTSHSERTYVNTFAVSTQIEKLDQAFGTVNANGSRIYLATLRLKWLVTVIIDKIESLKHHNIGNELAEQDQEPVANEVESTSAGNLLSEISVQSSFLNNICIDKDVSDRACRAAALSAYSKAMIDHQELTRKVKFGIVPLAIKEVEADVVGNFTECENIGYSRECMAKIDNQLEQSIEKMRAFVKHIQETQSKV